MDRFKTALRERAIATGFDVCRITSATLPTEIGEDLRDYVAEGHQGTMHWLADTRDRRQSPEKMWSDAKTAIVLGLNYGPTSDPLENLDRRSSGTISVYARNRDYHDIIKGRLKTVASWIVSQTNCEVKVFVDTAPLMEKPLAAQAGVGWQGKHTNLVSREFGSWLFLGIILMSTIVDPDETEVDHCGNCRACLDICPTKAFPAPYKIDARKCISYLTIEHKGPIPTEYRTAIGNRIYGCDDCLAVCPWNKFAKTSQELKLAERDELISPSLSELSQLNDADFRSFFSGSPIKRIGRSRFIRNVLIAIGNSGDRLLLENAKARLKDADPLVRGAAIWAVSRLENPDQFAEMRTEGLAYETDEEVREEWMIND